jgi:hypothetical protein
VIACSNDTHTVTESSRRNDCRGSSPFTVHPDASPPAFAGVKTATGGCGYYGCQNPAHLTWDPATDNVTPQGKIVYDIYRARFDQPGTQDFSAPTYTSSPGATSFTAPVEDTPVGCWVVRARDQLGNRDSNKQEICNSPPP